MSAKYAMRLISEKPKQAEIIKTILATPELQRLLFPAEMTIGFNKTIRLDSAEDFNISLVPQSDDPELGTTVSLECENGLYFSIMVNFQKHIVGSINLLFSLEHLEQGILNYESLKSIIFELIPIFQVSNGTIYNKSNKERIRYYSFPSTYDSYPLQIGWISYFNSYLVESIGRKKFEQLESSAEKIEFSGGFLISSVLEPFYYEDDQHREREAQIIADLGLELFARGRKPE